MAYTMLPSLNRDAYASRVISFGIRNTDLESTAELLEMDFAARLMKGSTQVRHRITITAIMTASPIRNLFMARLPSEASASRDIFFLFFAICFTS